ncbi:hypothetical protein SGLAM104S_09940 [Streptomyces glaucescens]
MHRRITAPGALAAASLLLAIPASAAAPSPGAPGIGDPYYPAYGNGGYDVSHYDLRLTYQPVTDRLEGTATLLARTTQDLSRFNLDFLLDVSEVRVNGVLARFTASGEHELEITPKTPLDKGTAVTVVVRYSGVPSQQQAYGFTSWHRTPDGGVAGERARGRLVVVPQQRPPAGQGHLRRVRAGAGRHPGHLQRHPAVDEFATRLDPVQLALQQAAGDVSRHPGRRAVRRHHREDRERHPGDQRLQQGPRRRTTVPRGRAWSGPGRSPTG